MLKLVRSSIILVKATAVASVLSRRNTVQLKSKIPVLFQSAFLYGGRDHFSTGMAKNNPGVLKSGEDPSKISDTEWKKRLPEERYEVLREKGTERPFTGEYTFNKESGMYHCGCCGAELFSSSSKFESGCGWPSFYEALGRHGRDESKTNVVRRVDESFGMKRVEVVCKKCDGHLGHVFNDGPNPTGERFCINSVSVDFVPKAKGSGKSGSKV